MRKNRRHQEKGSSLLLAILALLLLSAIAMGMAFMSGTETTVNANFKAEETAYFAARAGVEEVRDRLLPSNTNTLTAILPTTMPGTGAGSVLYVVNGITGADISSSTSQYRDDELCHDFNPAPSGLTWVPPGIRCPQSPGIGTFITQPSVAPYPLDYKWVRVTLKGNNSTAYCVDNSTYPCVNTNQVCWNGVSEVVRPTTIPICDGLSPKANPVYLVTALAVTQEGATNGARRLVQEEISQTPLPSFPYSLFATGTGCGSLSLSGGAQTFSFDSAAEPGGPTNPPSNILTSGGNIGSNGNISLGGGTTSVNGTTSSAIGGIGNCNKGDGISVSGGANYGTAGTIPVQTLPVPPAPNPLPPTTSQNISSNQSLPPGSYGNLNIQGGAVVTLAGGTPTNPAVYTINSISLAGGSTLVINGPVVFNMAGVGAMNVVNFTGGTFENSSSNPGNFVINYGGTNNISLSGGSEAYAVVNAPNANVSFSGGGNFYGQAIGSTISVTGGGNFYYDTGLNTPTNNNNAFYEISMRELSY